MNPAPSRVSSKYGKYMKYVGVPYADKGRDMRGWDCYGMYCFVLAEVMGKKPHTYDSEYPSADYDLAVVKAFAHRGEWQAVVPGAEVEGDGVVFNIGGVPLHCGYVLERGVMLHTLKGRQTCIESYDSALWVRRIEGFYKWN